MVLSLSSNQKLMTRSVSDNGHSACASAEGHKDLAVAQSALTRCCNQGEPAHKVSAEYSMQNLGVFNFASLRYTAIFSFCSAWSTMARASTHALSIYGSGLFNFADREVEAEVGVVSRFLSWRAAAQEPMPTRGRVGRELPKLSPSLSGTRRWQLQAFAP